jgi:hypothetical protein
MKISGCNLDTAVSKLINLEKVEDVFTIEGEGNLMLRVMVDMLMRCSGLSTTSLSRYSLHHCIYSSGYEGTRITWT